MGIPEMRQYVPADCERQNTLALDRDDVLRMIRSFDSKQERIVVVHFESDSFISVDCITTLAAMYIEALENAVTIKFSNVPYYIQQVFPDIPDMELPSISSYAGYQLVLVYRFGEFICEYSKGNFTGTNTLKPV